jgi:hypothetical protein
MQDEYESRITSYLSSYLFEKVYNQPNYEYRKNIIPMMVGASASTGNVKLRSRSVTLPAPATPFHTYMLTTKALGGLRLGKITEWTSLVDILANTGFEFRIHNTNGVMLPRAQVFARTSPESGNLLITIPRSMMRKLFGSKFDPRDLYVATYFDSANISGVNIDSYIIDAGSNQTSIFNKTQTADVVFVNGKYTTVETLEDFNTEGNYVEIITDQNISGSFSVDLSQKDERRNFISLLDNESKTIVHIPKALNPDNKLISHSHCDFYVVARNVEHPNREGLFLHRGLSERGMTQITHNDIAIPDMILNAYTESLDMFEMHLVVVIKDHGRDNFLIRDKNFIDQLYDNHDDFGIMERFEGQPVDDDEVLEFWKAEVLEASAYSRAIDDVPNDHPEALGDYVDMLGYYTVMDLICNRTRRETVTTELERDFKVSVPPIWKDANAIFPVVSINGEKVADEFITYAGAQVHDIVVHIDPSVTVVEGDNITIEMFDKTPDYSMYVSPNACNFLVERQRRSFTLYKVHELDNPITSIDSSFTHAYEDLTDDLDNYIEYTKIDDMPFLLFRPQTFGQKFVIVFESGFSKQVIDLEPYLEVNNPFVFDMWGPTSDITQSRDVVFMIDIHGGPLSDTGEINNPVGIPSDPQTSWRQAWHIFSQEQGNNAWLNRYRFTKDLGPVDFDYNFTVPHQNTHKLIGYKLGFLSEGSVIRKEVLNASDELIEEFTYREFEEVYWNGGRIDDTWNIMYRGKHYAYNRTGVHPAIVPHDPWGADVPAGPFREVMPNGNIDGPILTILAGETVTPYLTNHVGPSGSDETGIGNVPITVTCDPVPHPAHRKPNRCDLDQIVDTWEVLVDGVVVHSVTDYPFWGANQEWHVFLLDNAVDANSQVTFRAIDSRGEITIAIARLEYIFDDESNLNRIPLLGKVNPVLHVNGKELAQGIDFDFHEILDDRGFIVGRQAIVQNAEFLTDGGNVLDLMVTRDVSLSRVTGNTFDGILDAPEERSLIETISPINIAVNGSATASTVTQGRDPSVAIDGITAQKWSSGSVTMTNNHFGNTTPGDAWWKLQWNEDRKIAKATIWGRSEFHERLSNFVVQILDANDVVVAEYGHPGIINDSSYIEVDKFYTVTNGIRTGQSLTYYNGRSLRVMLLPEPTPTLDETVNFLQHVLSSFTDNQDEDPNRFVIDQNGSRLTMKGNSWKKVHLPFRITTDTILEFDFEGVIEGEFASIGVEDDNKSTNWRMFQLWGTDNVGNDNAQFKDYDISDGVKHYVIPIGQILEGRYSWATPDDLTYITFMNDDDAGSSSNAECRFSNVRIYDKNDRRILSLAEVQVNEIPEEYLLKEVNPLWYDGLSTASVDGLNLPNVSEQFGDVEVEDYRVGAVFGVRTSYPIVGQRYEQEYYNSYDTDLLRRINKYYADKTPVLQGPVPSVTGEHKIYSIYLALILRDLLIDSDLLPYEPDPVRLIEIAAPYEYLLQYDTARNIGINKSYIDILPSMVWMIGENFKPQSVLSNNRHHRYITLDKKEEFAQPPHQDWWKYISTVDEAAVSQPSRFDWATDADKAVDGEIEQTWGNYSMTHTENHVNPDPYEIAVPGGPVGITVNLEAGRIYKFAYVSGAGHIIDPELVHPDTWRGDVAIYLPGADVEADPYGNSDVTLWDADTYGDVIQVERALAGVEYLYTATVTGPHILALPEGGLMNDNGGEVIVYVEDQTLPIGRAWWKAVFPTLRPFTDIRLLNRNEVNFGDGGRLSNFTVYIDDHLGRPVAQKVFPGQASLLTTQITDWEIIDEDGNLTGIIADYVEGHALRVELNPYLGQTERILTLVEVSIYESDLVRQWIISRAIKWLGESQLPEVAMT